MRTDSPTYRGWSAERHGPAALIIGASDGIGAAFAERLARYGSDLVLVARRAEPLAELADRLRRHGVRVRTDAVDAATAEGRDRLVAIAGSDQIGLLVCNAALAPVGPFLDLAPADLDAMIDLNCRTAAHLARVCGERMTARGRGGLVLLSSMASDGGSAMVAHYAATKAYLRVLAEGLWAEWRSFGVDVLACCPGPVDTPTYAASQPRRVTGIMPSTLSARAVAADTLDALGRGPIVVPGRWNRLLAAATGLVSRRSRVLIASRRTRAMYDGNV